LLSSLLHLGGLLGALCALPLAAWPVAVLSIGLAFRRAMHAGPSDVTRAHGQIDGDWTLTRRDGQRDDGWRVDVARSFCHPWLVILALRRDRRRLYLPLAADAMHPDVLRRLRVSLRAAG